MPKREKTLAHLLRAAGYAVESGNLARPSKQCLGTGSKSTWGEIARVYKELGGILSDIPFRPGRWDLEIEGVAVELDEEQHFNRYRLITLDSSLYESNFGFPSNEYRSYCELHEVDCIRKASNRGYWSSKSTIAQFGAAGPQGDLTPPGSPRWKQRAFYDFLKDVAPVLTETRVSRVSIWDMLEIAGSRISIGDVLDQSIEAAVPGVIDLIRKRSTVAGAAV